MQRANAAFVSVFDALSARDIGRISSAQWEVLIADARESNLLGTLAHRLEALGRLDDVPPAPRAHLASALIVAAAQARAVRTEIPHIAAALADLPIPVVLLKGAAYLLAELPPAVGRMFSDIDILVPRSALADVEAALMLAGYATMLDHPYDQYYFRHWAHELPPMQHVKRLTVIDVHHAIVPRTARIRPSSEELIRAARPLDAPRGFRILAPPDMLLHSATHLFNDEELEHAPRDLVDFDALVRLFGTEERFWGALVERAGQLSLGRPLYYALRWSARLLGTPVPNEIVAAIDRYSPRAAIRSAMDALFSRALQPTLARPGTRWARRALYVRGHWLKMPLPLLTFHLTVKLLRRNEQPA